MPVVASSTVASVNVWATITPDRSTPRWSFFHPRWPRPPCFAATHSPSPTIERPVLSMMRWSGPLAGTRSSSTSRCRLRRDSVVWSGASRSTSIKAKTDRKKPSAWRKGRRKTSRSVNAVVNREIREPLLPTRLTGRHRSPRVPGVGREPQRHVASPHERPFVRPPIPDAICGLVLRVHPRLHGTNRVPRAVNKTSGSTIVYRNAAKEPCTNARRPADAPLRRQGHQRHQPASVRRLAEARWGGLANGDIGIVVEQYKTKKLKGLPQKLEVEFAWQLGPKYGFY